MAVVKSLVEYKRGDSPSPSHNPRVIMLNVGKTRDQGSTLLRNDQVRPLVARMVRAKTNEKSSNPGPIASYVMDHTGRETAPRGKP